MRLKNLLRLGKNSDDRVSDFMLSENLACELVCAETNSVFVEEIWSERRKSCQNFVGTGVSSQKIHEVGIT